MRISPVEPGVDRGQHEQRRRDESADDHRRLATAPRPQAQLAAGPAHLPAPSPTAAADARLSFASFDLRWQRSIHALKLQRSGSTCTPESPHRTRRARRIIAPSASSAHAPSPCAPLEQPHPDAEEIELSATGGSSIGTSFGLPGVPASTPGAAPASTGPAPGRHSRSPVGRPVHSSPAGHCSSSLAAQWVRQRPSRHTASPAHEGCDFHTVQPVGAFSQTAGAPPAHFPAPSAHAF